MAYYCDIWLLPDQELSPAHLMSALFNQLHRALARRSGDIGISFPDMEEARPWLGQRLRLHGAQAALQELMTQPWSAGLADYVRVEPLAAVPAGALHRSISRVQAKSSVERLRRRQMRRHDLTLAEAALRIPLSVERHLALPYVTIRSSSNAQRFHLFIQHGLLQQEAQPGSFSSYGLSQGATIPWF